MTYRDLNSEKLSYLLAKGTHEGELKRFFEESKKLLLLKQAKIQNLPYGRIERIRTISEKLPRSTDDIVGNWFRKNITLAEPTPVDEVLSDLILYEEMKEPIPEEDGKQLARSALVHLFADDPPPSLIAFLKGRPGGEANAEPQKEAAESGEGGCKLTNGDSDPPVGPFIGGVASSQQLSDLLAAVIVGDETAIDEALAPYTQNVQTMVDALIRARRGDMAGAASLAEMLSSDSHEYALLQRAFNQARHGHTSTALTSPGLRVIAPQPLTDHPDREEFDIVGVCSNETEKVIFVRPLGLVIDEKIYLLDTEDRARLFPESGDVMSFRVGGRRLPNRGDIVRWVVTERDDAGGKTRFHYVDEVGPMIEVINVPFSSSAPDEVRHYIKDLMALRKVVSQPYPLFALADGVTIAVPKSNDPRQDEAYEKPWQAWGSLDTWLLEGRPFSMGTPNTPASHVDLMSLDMAFKKLVKNIVVEQKATITKTAIRDLAAMIRSQDTGEVKLRAQRVANALDRIVLDTESLEALFPILVSREEVQRRADELVETYVETKLKERVGLTTELDILRKRKDELQRESKVLERQTRKQKMDVEKTVAQAFGRAIDAGIESLAQAEIFRTLSASNDRTTKAAVRDETTETLEVRIENGALTKGEVISGLVALGLKRRHATALALLTQLMAKAGGWLVVRGQDARQVVRVLGHLDSSVSASMEIPMGLTSSAPLRRALDALDKNVEAIALLNADLSPIEIYGSSILDRPFDAAIGGILQSAPLILSCTGGDLALPIPPSIRRVAIVFDLDSMLDLQEGLLGELEEDDIPLLRSIFASLVTEVEQLQGAERDLIEGVLTTALKFPT